jgi:hypothetical protein
MIELKIDYKSERASNFLNKMTDNLKNLSPVFGEFVDYYKTEIITESFESKGALMGMKWQELTPKYRKWKGRGVDLRLTERLYNAAKGGDGWFQTIRNNGATFGIKGGVIKYANRHQNGTAGMPQRPYFYKADKTMPEKANKKLEELLKGKING